MSKSLRRLARPKYWWIIAAAIVALLAPLQSARATPLRHWRLAALAALAEARSRSTAG